MHKNLKILARVLPWSFGYGLQMYHRNPIDHDKIAICSKIEFTSYDISAGAVPESETIIIDEISAQSLMDSLWNCGIRPTEGAGSAGAMAAQGKHLADMRQIVFKALEQEPPK